MSDEKNTVAVDLVRAAGAVNISHEFVTAFCTAWGAKQVGAIVHGGGINHHAFAEEAEMSGLIPVELRDHTRLYRFDSK